MDIDKHSSLDLDQIISDRYNQLTNSEKHIANYLRKNQEESAFFTAGELAERVDMSEATLIRFARSLGFSSFPALRTVLQEAFRRRFAHITVSLNRMEKLRQGESIFESMVASQINFLSQALETVSHQALQKTVEFLRTCEHIFIFGAGPSISLVDLMEIRLRRYGRSVIPLTTSGREILEPLWVMKKNDMLFMMCFFHVSPIQKLVLEYAKEVNCPIVILTDTISSDISDKADVVLAAKRSQIVESHSFVVPMTIVDTLLVMFASEEQDYISTSLDKLDQLRERLKNIEEPKNIPNSNQKVIRRTGLPLTKDGKQ